MQYIYLTLVYTFFGNGKQRYLIQEHREMSFKNIWMINVHVQKEIR